MSFSFEIMCRKSLLCVFLLSIVLHHKLSYAKVLTAGALNLYLEHSDNVFSSPAETAVSGITYLLTPSVNFNIPGRKTRWGLSYSYAYEKNDINNDNDADAVALTPNLTPVSGQGSYERQYHDLVANMGWTLSRKVEMNFIGSYNINFQSVRPGQVLNFAPNEQTRTDTNFASWTVLWNPTQKLSNDFSLSRMETTYENSTVPDILTTTGTYTMAYDFLRWMQVGAGVTYSTLEYDITTSGGGGGGNALNPSLTAPNAPLDMSVLNYNLNVNLDLKYFVIGLSYGILQTKSRGKRITVFSAGGLPLFVTQERGAGILKNISSVFSVNISANSPKVFKIKNITVEITSGQQFNVDLAGQGYISRTLGLGLGYKWKSLAADVSIMRTQDKYISNNNQTFGTAGTLNINWSLTKKTAVTLTGTRTKFEYDSDGSAGLTAAIGVGPASFPQGQPSSVLQEFYIDITHSWTTWLTSAISFGRREGEPISSFTVVGAGAGAQSIGAGYLENLMTFSTMATF